MSKRHKHSRVGGRSAADIKADPQATAEEVQSLSNKEPLAAAVHPNCPEKLWWYLAERHPVEALANPASQLFLLESPERWAEMEAKQSIYWIIGNEDALPLAAHRLFAVDCAEHVLSVFERQCPQDKRPRHALQVARAFAKGDANDRDLLAAYNEAHEAAEDMQRVSNGTRGAKQESAYAARHAAWSACYATNTTFPPPPGTSFSASAMGFAADAAHHTGTGFDAETIWQWRLLLRYLQGDVPQVGGLIHVGARTYKSLRQNPTAKESILRSIAEKRPLEALRHPNCPQDLWWELAAKYPLDAEESAAYDLMTLESPERWTKIQQTSPKDWILTYTDKASPRTISEQQLRLFMTDCAAHVLPIYESVHPKDKKPRQALEIARLVARGHATDAQAAEAANLAYLSAQSANTNASAYAAYAAYHASFPPGSIWESVREAAKAAGSAAGISTVRTASAHNTAVDAEFLWQWQRLVQYLRGEGVGARRNKPSQATLDAFKAMGTAEEVATLSKRSPLKAVVHPNCPPELWWKLAARYPFEAMQNPAYELFLVEEPVRWVDLERDNLDDWLDLYLEGARSKLTVRADKQRFSADCAAHVLPIFEKKYPHCTMPHATIALLRQVADGVASADALSAAGNAINDDYQAKTKYAANYAALAVWCATSRFSTNADTRETTRYAQAAAELDANGGNPLPYGRATKASAAAGKTEALWQWRRLVEYLQGTAKPLPVKSVVGSKPKPKGPRSHEEVKEDPQATEEELQAVFHANPLEALRHPNCPRDLWWTIARDYPMEAQESVLFGLLTVEEPERWDDLERANSLAWVSDHLARLSMRDLRLFAADCAERVRPLWEKIHPNDDRAQRALEVARQFARGETWGADALESVWIDPDAKERYTANQLSQAGAMQAAKAINEATRSYDPADYPMRPLNQPKFHGIRGAQNVCSEAIKALEFAAGNRDGKIRDAERMWQWRRLQEYLRGKASPISVGGVAGKSKPSAQPFHVRFAPKVEKAFPAIPREVQRRTTDLLAKIACDPRRHGAIRLKSDRSIHRIKVGAYRVLYEIDDDAKVILVTGVSARQEAYEKYSH